MSLIDKIFKDKKSTKIQSYDGEGMTYSSNDEDYEEFLKNLDIISAPSPAEVGDTTSFNIHRSAKNEQTTDEAEAKPHKMDKDKQDDDVLPKMYMDMTDDKLLSISSNIERLTNIVENNDIRKTQSLDKVIRELSLVSSQLEEVKSLQSKMRHSISDMAKVSDSVFDLKNTQQGMKNAMQNMDIAVVNLKKRLVSCMTLLSILSFLVVVMQILNLFS